MRQRSGPDLSWAQGADRDHAGLRRCASSRRPQVKPTDAARGRRQSRPSPPSGCHDLAVPHHRSAAGFDRPGPLPGLDREILSLEGQIKPAV